MGQLSHELGRLGRGVINEKVAKEARGSGGGWAGAIPSFG